jgi:hypothetical protein
MLSLVRCYRRLTYLLVLACGVGLLAGSAGGDEPLRKKESGKNKESRAEKTRKMISEIRAIYHLKPQEFPAEKTRKSLDQIVTLNFTGQTIQEAVTYLRKKTEMKFVLDPTVFGFGAPAPSPQIRLAPPPPGVNAGPPGGNEDPPVVLKVTKGKLRTALRNMLNRHNLGYAILGETVLITYADLAVQRQMGQMVSVDLDKVSLVDALGRLAKETATNLIIDPRVMKEAKSEVSLQLDEVSLETAVRLIAELTGLKSMRLENVLLVTSEKTAHKLRIEQRENRMWQFPVGPEYGPPPAIVPGGPPNYYAPVTSEVSAPYVQDVPAAVVQTR